MSSLNFVMVWWFLAELCPFHFENNINFQFPFIISLTVGHFQLKFDIWICHRNAQVNWKFGHGLMIFGRVMLLSLWKYYEIFSFRSLSPQQLDIFNSNLIYGYEFGHGLMIADRLIPLVLWKKNGNFQFLFIISPLVVHIQLKFDNSNLTYRYILGKSSSSFNLVVVQWFLTKLSFLNVGKFWIFSSGAHTFVEVYM
jgi:hypothetical protein